MKIGHLIHWDGPGGGPQAIMNLARGFKSRGMEQVLFCGGRGRLAEFCQVEGVAREEVPIDRKIALPWGFGRLVWALRCHRPDVLFLHGQWGAPVGALAAWLVGVPTIYIIRFPSFYTDWTPWRAFRNAWAEWIPCRLARRVIALSPSIFYQYLCRGWARPGAMRQISNLFSLDVRPTAAEIDVIRERLLGSAERGIQVVSVGRLEVGKRVDWLIQAWPRVIAACPRARLWIVGDGPEAESLRQLAVDCGISASCRFLGAQPRGIAYLAFADVVVMTTLYEAWGFVPVEAMACGRPVVVTAADGVRDQLTDGVEGCLVPPGDSDRLAEALIELIRDPVLRERMGVAGRNRVARLVASPVLDQYIELINEVRPGDPSEPVSEKGK